MSWKSALYCFLLMYSIISSYNSDVILTFLSRGLSLSLIPRPPDLGVNSCFLQSFLPATHKLVHCDLATMCHRRIAHKVGIDTLIVNSATVWHWHNMKNNNRILNEIFKRIGEREKMEKRIEETELNLSVQKEIETEKTKREREITWILNGGKYPVWAAALRKKAKNSDNLHSVPVILRKPMLRV